MSVREAILVLLDEGDFSTMADIPRIADADLFKLRVDWNEFEEGRSASDSTWTEAPRFSTILDSIALRRCVAVTGGLIFVMVTPDVIVR